MHLFVIQNSGPNSGSSTVKFNANSNSWIANDALSTSSRMGSNIKESSTNMDSLALIVQLGRRDEAKGSGGASNVPNTAKDERKRHKCVVCGYATRQRGHLNQHMRIHTGEQPYRCGICFESFNVSSNLKRHIKMVHVKLFTFESEKTRHDQGCRIRQY